MGKISEELLSMLSDKGWCEFWRHAVRSIVQMYQTFVYERDKILSQRKWFHSDNLQFLPPGSTHILTPRKLLDDIKMLNKSKDKVSFKDE
jgi:hypothetical protein